MTHIHFLGIDLFWYLLALAFLLPRIPIVGKFFNIINTLFHELGHAFMALLLQGEVTKIQIFSDTSGVTVTKSKSAVAAFFISLAGYPFASIAAYIAWYLMKYHFAMWFILGLSLLFLIILIFFIRNIYGIIWVLLFTALNGLLIFYFKNDTYLEIAATFYALSMLIESIWSPIVLLYLSFTHPEQAGDAANLKNITHIPAFFWALLFVGFSGLVTYYIIYMIFIPIFSVSI